MQQTPMARVTSFLQLLLIIAGLSALAALAWQWGKTAVDRDTYRNRLAGLEKEHNALVADYNKAVARTAVCEVRSRGGKLSIVVATADGRSEEIPLPFDPSREIHFDFVCLADRLHLRRVYDDRTAPKDGTPIDSKLSRVDWSRHADDRGLVLYRPVAEGTYALRVSGNGALTLEPVQASVADQLKREPELGRYEPAGRMQNADRPPGILEIWRALIQR